VVASTEGRKPIAILVVEDEVLIGNYIKEILSAAGFEVIGVAASGPEAMSLAAQTQPTLALADIGLTGPIDGIELARRLRQEFSVPSIFLSGLIDERTIKRSATAQPLGFLEKPFIPSRMFAAIERALATLALADPAGSS
jgi:two-component system, response regulator PdtaR